MARGKAVQFAVRRGGIGDDCARRHHRVAHAAGMAVGLSRAAEFGMGDRDQVVNQEHRVQPARGDPARQRGMIEPGVADIQIDLTRKGPAGTGTEQRGQHRDKSRAKAGSVTGYQVKQLCRLAL